MSSIRQLAEASAGELRALEVWLGDKVGFNDVSFRTGQEAIDSIAVFFANFAPESPEPAVFDPPQALTPSLAVGQMPPRQTGPPAAEEPDDSADGWIRADDLVRSDCPQEGIAKMARLVASAPCGREVFIRKLNLAETCLATGVDLLAVSIFEELTHQIDFHKLEQWEQSDLIGRVWLGLYKCYSRASSEAEDIKKAARAYARFCQLNPWKAYGIDDFADRGHPSSK